MLQRTHRSMAAMSRRTHLPAAAADTPVLAAQGAEDKEQAPGTPRQAMAARVATPPPMEILRDKSKLRLMTGDAHARRAADP